MLPGGTIERYLPSFFGDLFDAEPGSETKCGRSRTRRAAGNSARADDPDRDAVLAARYGALYEVVRKLPSQAPVDFDGVLRGYLSDYVHELQKVVAKHSDWERDRIDKHMQQRSLQKSGVVWLDSFQRDARRPFRCDHWRIGDGRGRPSLSGCQLGHHDRKYGRVSLDALEYPSGIWALSPSVHHVVSQPPDTTRESACSRQKNPQENRPQSRLRKPFCKSLRDDCIRAIGGKTI